MNKWEIIEELSERYQFNLIMGNTEENKEIEAQVIAILWENKKAV